MNCERYYTIRFDTVIAHSTLLQALISTPIGILYNNQLIDDVHWPVIPHKHSRAESHSNYTQQHNNIQPLNATNWKAPPNGFAFINSLTIVFDRVHNPINIQCIIDIDEDNSHLTTYKRTKLRQLQQCNSMWIHLITRRCKLTPNHQECRQFKGTITHTLIPIHINSNFINLFHSDYFNRESPLKQFSPKPYASNGFSYRSSYIIIRSQWILFYFNILNQK